MGMREQIVRALAGRAAAPLGGKPGGVWEGGIRAYHSSPHDFEKVDFSKLRTGEGANVYGAGHYMAENPAVSGQGGQYWNQFLNRFKGEEALAADMLRHRGFDREQAATALQKSIAEHQAELDAKAFIYPMSDKPPTPMADEILLGHRMNMEKRQRALDLIASDKPVGPRTYEMNLRAKPEELLDWDKPLRDQPQVLDALSGSRRKSVQETLKAHDYEAPTRVIYGTDIGPVTGQDFYKALSLNLTGKTVAPQASDALRAGGIPGIRYLDAGSRRGPGGMTSAGMKLDVPPPSYNYVGVDPSKLEVLAKYGVAGAAAIPPTLGAFTSQDKYEVPDGVR